MSSVDDRIVNMQFNNKQFESGATQSRKTLSDLESAITKTGQSKGLGTLAAGADGASKKFSLMKIAGISAVATIASKATVAGLGLIKSLTIDPILQGWDEYNTNLKSIQTVMANTGKGIKPVQAALQELNKFSDQTIYNFSEMARNVGTFTAAGVGLKTSVASIKGIANIAALSGSSSQQASTAMYQLSQAIAAGRVNLQDWNSVVNAGMGGKKLQTALVQTGVAMGKLDAKTVHFGKTIKISGESFRNSISAKPGQTAWLTSDVLTKTLALMDGRLSKSALSANLFAKNLKLSADKQLSATDINKKAAEQLKQNQKLLAKQGFSPEQIASLTKMADAAYNSATVIKTLPQLMGVVKESIGSVWANAFTGIVGNFNESKTLWTNAGKSIQKVTNGFNAGLTNMIANWKKGIDGINGRTAVIKGFQALFKTLGSVLGTVGKAFREVFPPGGESTLAKISIGFMRLMQALVPSAPTLKNIQSIFAGIFAVMHIGLSLVTGIAAGFGALFGAMFQGSGKAGGGVLALLGTVGEFLQSIDKMLTSGGKMRDFFVTIGTVLGTALHPAVAVIAGLVSAAGNFATKTQGISSFADTVASKFGSLSGSGDKIAGMFHKIADAVSSLNPGQVKATFQTIASSIGSIAGQGLSIASNIIGGIVSGLISQGAPALFAAMKTVGTAVIDGIKGALGISSPAAELIPVGINAVMGIVVGILQAVPQVMGAVMTVASQILTSIVSGLDKIGPSIADAFSNLFGGMDALDWASTFNAIFTGVFLLSAKKVATTVVDFKKIFLELKGTVVDTFKAFQSQLKAKALMELAIAIGLLTVSLIALSFIDAKKLAISLGAIGVMLAMLVNSLGTLSEISKGEGTQSIMALSGSIALIAGAMVMLATAVAIMGRLSLGDLAKGLVAMGIGMAIMVSAVESMAGLGPLAKGAAGGMVLMAIAMNIMAGAVGLLGNMDILTLAKGLGAMAIGMSIFEGALAVLTVLGPGVAAAGAGILMAATAMSILAVAVGLFGQMDIGTLAKGLGAVGLAITIFTVALGVLAEAGPGVLAAGGAMIMMATAMGLLVPVIGLLGSMDWGTLAKGIGALAIVLGIAAVALAAFGVIGEVVGPGLLMVGAALALAGVGMLAFGTGFALMAAAGVAGVAVLTAAFTAIIMLLPSLAVQVAAALTSMIQTFAKAAPKWRSAMGTIIKAMLGTVRDAVPELAKTLIVMVNAGINVLRKTVPKFIELGFAVIDAFLKSAKKHAPSIINSVSTLIVTFLNGMAKNMGRITEAGANLVIKFVNGVARAINGHAGELGTAGLHLAGALINGMTGGLLSKGISAIQRAWSQVLSHIPAVARKLLHLGSPSKLTRWHGEMVVAGLVNGLSSQDAMRSTKRAAEDWISVVPATIESALEIASPSKKAKWWGDMIGAGLSAGLRAAITPAVRATLDLMNSVTAAGDSNVGALDRAATLAEAKATRSATRANVLKSAASKVSSKNKAAKHAANAAAQRAAALAAADQKAADKANTRVANAIAFRDADAKGRGDIQEAAAVSRADTAAKLMARAGQEAAMAKSMASKNAALAARLRAQSKKDAAAAKKYALDSVKYRNQALASYAVEVNTRIKSLEDAAAADKKAKDDQAELDAADAQGKADILNKRADANEALAATAKATSEALIAQAKTMAGKDATQAMKLLDEAEAAAADAKAAADAAVQQRNDAATALGQDTTGTGPGSVQPSRSVLEDAASVVDRFNESLAEATAAAASEQTVLQFTQNNSSPEALSVSEIYRQSNNLISLAALKMGPKKPGSN